MIAESEMDPRTFVVAVPVPNVSMSDEIRRGCELMARDAFRAQEEKELGSLLGYSPDPAQCVFHKDGKVVDTVGIVHDMGWPVLVFYFFPPPVIENA